MAIGAEQLEILQAVVAAITVDVVERQSKWLVQPFGDPTRFAGSFLERSRDETIPSQPTRLTLQG